MTGADSIPDIELEPTLKALGLKGALLITAETRATDTRVWKVAHGGRSLAIRVYRENQRSAMETELQGMKLASRHGIPVPAVVATGSVHDRFPAMAIDWLPGGLVGETIVRNPARARRLGLSAGRLLAQMHAAPVETDTSTILLAHDWVSRAGKIEDWLRFRLDDPARQNHSLLHLDYHPYNLITNGPGVTGVLDWTNAALGDPRADVARAVSLLRVVAPVVVAARGAHRVTLGRYTRSFLAGYESTAGRLEDMEPFYAWAGLVIQRDLAPKAAMIVPDGADRLMRKIERWISHWLARASVTPELCQSP
jgi:aminoglycoside phosphotransferase (APT) family kinase protein